MWPYKLNLSASRDSSPPRRGSFRGPKTGSSDPGTGSGNPKTPPGLTVQFLPRLGTRDLRIVAGDKNIPELVRRNARNLFLARTQPSKRMKKAH